MTLSLLSLILTAALQQPPDRPYLEAALQAAQWIGTTAIRTEGGTAWPADPRDPGSVQASLYSGAPGVVLFFLEAYRATGDRRLLEQAEAGADFLIASLPDVKGSGLCEGIAGAGFALREAFKASGEERFLQAFERCLELIRRRAVRQGSGVEWSGTTDIISGSSGTGLFLLYAARELRDASLRELAAQAGLRLVELGRPDAGGLKWAMNPEFPRLMPNFSHGTAGVSYFLATLHQETGNRRFLQAAIAGARYLQAVAAASGASCLVFHNEPDGKELYYLGWCHGPPGTARLFYRLYRITGETVWLEWVRKSARAIIESGIPDKQTPGFWNNVSICCGSAGIAEHFLDLHRVTGDREYLDFAKDLTANLLARATKDSLGMRWIQAEHRTRPDLLIAQTGLMQGAAGIGMWLLHLDTFERGLKPSIVMPDSPF